MSMRIRDSIEVGNKYTYKGKRYLVVYIDFDCGGNVMIVGLVKLHKDWHPSFLVIKNLYDEQIEALIPAE